MVLWPSRAETEKFLLEFIRKAEKNPNSRLSIDLETTGLDPYTGEITVVGMSHNGHEVFIVRPEDIPVGTFNLVMADEKYTKTFHNAKFDMKWLMNKFNSTFANADCSFVMQKLITLGLRDLADLETCSAKYLALPMDKEVRLQFIGNSVVSQEMAEYAALDVAATWHLWEVLKRRVFEEELDLCYNVIEKPLIAIVAEMELTGLDVNRPYLALMQSNLEAKIIRFQNELDNIVRYFGAMPTKKRKLKVAEKAEWVKTHGGLAPDYIDEEVESLNVNSADQVVHVLVTLGFNTKSSSKDALDNLNYTESAMKVALGRLEKYGKEKKFHTPPTVLTNVTGGKTAKAPKPGSPEAIEAEINMIRRMMAGEVIEAPKPVDEPVETIRAIDAVSSVIPDIEPLWKPGMTTEDVELITRNLVLRVQDLRAASKAVTAFVAPLQLNPFPGQEKKGYKGPKGYVNPTTGRVHANFGQMETGTGRFNCTVPNFQQMPSARKDSIFDGMTFRRAFVPPAGCRMIILDYQACEVRILAQLCKDKNLIIAMTYDDPHVYNAAIMFDVSIEEVLADAAYCKEHGGTSMRQKAKTGIFTLVYGGGKKRIAAVLGCSIAQAQNLMDVIFAKFPGVPRWIAAKKAAALRDGYVLSLSGRRRYFDRPVKPVYDTSKAFNYHASMETYKAMVASIERQAQNAPVQATNADITKLAMVRVAEAIRPFGAKLVLSIHDELIATVPEEHAEAAYEVMRVTMIQAEEEFLQDVVCKVDGKISDHWDH